MSKPSERRHRILGLFVTALLMLSSAAWLSMARGEGSAGGETRTKEEPRFMLDSGGHTAIITDIAFTPDGKYVVSAGYDKVIRVWDWQASKTVRTIRGQVGQGHEGKIYAMALSPDGKWLAVGGFMIHIRLFNFATGELKALLKGHRGSVLGLAFSPDSKRLISGSADDTAMIWDVKKAEPLHRLKGHTDPIQSVAFNGDGSVAVTASSDRTVRSWRTDDGEEIAVMKGHTDRVMAVAVSPRDGTIASGSWDETVRLWDARSGELKKTLSPPASPWRLAFSRDGKFLASGRGHVWNLDTRDLHLVYEETGHRAVAVSHDGKLAATVGTDEPTIHVWRLDTGRTKQKLGGNGAEIWAAAFSSDGSHFAWGNVQTSERTPNKRGELAFVMRLPSRNRSLGSPRSLFDTKENYIGAITRYGEFELKRDSTHTDPGVRRANMNLLDIFRTGQRVGRIDWSGEQGGYRHQAYTFSHDGKIIATGGAAGELWAYDGKGQTLGPYVGHVGYIYALAASPDNRFLLSGATDQELKLWNLETRELIVTLFHGLDGEWVMWTPQGYYTSSPNGDRMVGWQINLGEDKAARYVRAAQLKRHLYSPEIINEAIRNASAKQAVRRLRGTDPTLSLLLARTPPNIKITKPATGASLSTNETSLIVEIGENPDPIESFAIFVNGRQVTAPTDKGFVPEAAQDDAQVRRFTIPLANGENRIRVTARNWVGDSEPQEITVINRAQGTLDTRDTLYVVAVGVDNYPSLPPICGGPEGTCELRFAGKDARAFHDTIIATAGPLHKKVESVLLFNGAGGEFEPTRNKIEDALDIFKTARPNDTVVVFLSGHGVNDNDNYIFLPTDASTRKKGDWRSSSVLSWALITVALDKAQGRRILFVDTCRAAGAYNARLLKDSTNKSITVFSASDSESVAQERNDIENGVFTHVVLRGLKGEADLIKDNRVKLFELALFVDEHVQKTSNNTQQPEINTQGAKNYVLTAQW